VLAATILLLVPLGLVGMLFFGAMASLVSSDFAMGDHFGFPQASLPASLSAIVAFVLGSIYLYVLLGIPSILIGFCAARGFRKRGYVELTDILLPSLILWLAICLLSFLSQPSIDAEQLIGFCSFALFGHVWAAAATWLVVRAIRKEVGAQ
jgi:hypothetical protein